MQARVGLSLVASAVGAALALPATASAELGDLTFTECIANGGLSSCTDPANDSLQDASGVAVSPDGESVYVAATMDDSITHFTRNTSTGALTFDSCVAEGGNDGCDDPATDSLDGAVEVVVAPDGTSVYVVSVLDDSITHFTRDPMTGDLTFDSCIAEAGASTCADPGAVDSIDDPVAVAISPNGASVYVASFNDSSVTHFTRDMAGDLTFQGCLANAGMSGCTNLANDSLAGAASVEVSPDGASVYVGGQGDNSITHFTRDMSTGALAEHSCIANAGGSGCADPPNDSFNDARWMDISPDGTSVYITAQSARAINHLVRGAGGGLTFFACIADGGLGGCVDPPMDTLNLARGVAVSPDGASVYAVSSSDAITSYTRGAGGALTFDSCISNAGVDGCVDPPMDSLADATAVAVSPDGSSVYVASQVGQSITHFTRDTTPPALPPAPPPDGDSPDTDPPDTTITLGPKAKTRKKAATFGFISSEPGSSFQCSLDGAPFAPCISPQSVRVKKGKHTFEARATDAAGNTDPTPARSAWKVKRKRKRR